MSLRHHMHRPVPGPVPVFESSSENRDRDACACARWRREGVRLCAQRGWRAKPRAGYGMYGILQRFGLSIPYLLHGDFKPYPNVTRVAWHTLPHGVADQSPQCKVRGCMWLNVGLTTDSGRLDELIHNALLNRTNMANK